ncbi:MAG: methyltransferase domain-containing protein [Myxococcales bacterium]|nr:methyltransferase domain-containing protein [Myxococcales bacterium]
MNSSLQNDSSGSVVSRLADVAWKLLAGKTLIRALMEQSIHGVELYGRVLDLGSKKAETGYREAFRRKPGTEFTCTDLNAAPGVIECDVRKEFPFDECTFDFVLAFNLLEHVYEFSNLFLQSHRVLRGGGKLIGFVPFIHHFHPDPDDFFRFSSSALRRVLTEHGFVSAVVEPQAVGPVTTGLQMASAALLPGRLSVLRAVSLPLSMACDWTVVRFRRGIYRRDYWALGYTFLACKPEARSAR